MRQYIAHKNDETGKIQTVKEHSENTAKLCSDYSISPLKSMMYNVGLLHDIGKYQEAFQKRISGDNVWVEHSICGAQAAKEKYGEGAMGLMMAYCIAGHHTGLPDGGFQNDTKDMSTLCGRLKRDTEDYSTYTKNLKN